MGTEANLLEEYRRSGRDAPSSRRAGWLARSAMVLAIGVVALGAAEAITRAFVTLPSRQTFDPELGFRYIPHSTVFNGGEGGARLTLNALGFNDDEVGPKGGRRRVVIVGDSMTEAREVRRPDNYVAQLKRMRPEVDTVNIAQASAGPLEYRVLLKRHRDTLDPDLVVFAFSAGDLADLQAASYSLRRGSDGMVEDVEVKASQRNLMKQLVEPVLQTSALATHLMRRAGPIMTRLQNSLTWSVAAGTSPKTEGELLEVLGFILKEAAARGPVAAVFLPQLTYLPGRQARIADDSVADLNLIRSAAASTGVPLVVPDGALAEEYARTGQPGHGFRNLRIGSGHLNPDGHRAVASTLAELIDRPALR